MRKYIDILNEAIKAPETPAFQTWFQGSKVVDNSGNPLVCYHGTFRDFAEFQNHDNGWAGSGFNRIGFWFDVDHQTPSWLAGYEEGYGIGDGGNVVPCYLNIKKPWVISGDMIWEEDLDSIRVLRQNVKDAYEARRTAERGSWNYGTLEIAYRDANKAFDAAMAQLMKDDPWTRMRRMMPNGENATTAEVAEFQAQVIAEGYDGIHLVQTMADAGVRNYRPTDWWIAFHSKQIKSVFAKEFRDDSSNISEDV